jgi:patatin-like phospholipase/acyl hydrolase
MRLLSLDSEGIKGLIEQLENESEEIKNNSLKMAWYMRGGASYTDIMNMSISERKAISKIIEDNMDTTKKSGLPFF